MQDFRSLDAWNKAHSLVLLIHRQVQALPKEETFGLNMMLRRASLSIACRIAEGCGRSSREEFALDLRKATASCNELEYLILVAHDLGYWSDSLAQSLTAEAVEVRKMLYGLLRTLA